MKVRELTGAQLDYWVAKAEGYSADLHQGVLRISRQGAFDLAEVGYAPSTDWSQGGPLIERERIALMPATARQWWTARHPAGDPCSADTVLEAAMRAFVASKFGDEVPDKET